MGKAVSWEAELIDADRLPDWVWSYFFPFRRLVVQPLCLPGFTDLHIYAIIGGA